MHTRETQIKTTPLCPTCVDSCSRLPLLPCISNKDSHTHARTRFTSTCSALRALTVMLTPTPPSGPATAGAVAAAAKPPATMLPPQVGSNKCAFDRTCVPHSCQLEKKDKQAYCCCSNNLLYCTTQGKGARLAKPGEHVTAAAAAVPSSPAGVWFLNGF